MSRDIEKSGGAPSGAFDRLRRELSGLAGGDAHMLRGYSPAPPKGLRLSSTLSSWKATESTVRELARVEKMALASVRDAVMDYGFVTNPASDSVFVDSIYVPQEGAYCIDRQMLKLIPATEREFDGLDWHLKLTVHHTAATGVKDGRPLILERDPLTGLHLFYPKANVVAHAALVGP